MSNRRLRSCLVAALLVTVSSWSSAAPRPAVRTVSPLAALGRPAKLDLSDVPIRELAARLGEQFKLSVYLDVPRLEEAKIGLDAKVSLAAQYKSLEEGLTALLKPAGMAWQVRDDVLVLTTPESAETVSDTVVYQSMPPVDFDLLIERVVKVEPKTWAEAGGTGLLKQLSPDLLIVNQTHGIQSEIAAQFTGTLRPTAHVAVKNSQTVPPALARALALPAACSFERTPLDDALKALGRESKLTLSLDKSVGDSGVAANTPITCVLRGAKLATALSLLLEPLELTYVPEKRGFRITTLVQEETELTTISYPAADLATDGAGTELMYAVNTTVAPTTWNVVGGSGEVEFHPGTGLLEVKQTFNVHRQVEQLLADIRAARGR